MRISDWSSDVCSSDLSLPGVTPAPPPTTIDTGCRDDLVTVDGAPLPVRVSGRSADASAGRGLDLERCSAVALDLAAGSHDVSTAWGRDVGIDVDRLVLRTPRWSSSAASAEIGRASWRGRGGQSV